MVILAEGGDFFQGDTCLPAVGDDVVTDTDLGAESFPTVKHDAATTGVGNRVAPEVNPPSVMDRNCSLLSSVIDEVLSDSVACKIPLTVVITIRIPVLIVFASCLALVSAWPDVRAIVDDADTSHSGIVNGVVLDKAIKGILQLNPSLPAIVEMIASDHMPPFHCPKAVRIDAHTFCRTTNIVDVIAFNDVVMGTVHAPDPPDIEVVNVVASEGVMMACVIQILHSVFGSFVLAAIHLVGFKEVVTSVDLHCANDLVVSDRPVVRPSASAVASPCLEQQCVLGVALKGQSLYDPILGAIKIGNGGVATAVDRDGLTAIVGKGNWTAFLP